MSQLTIPELLDRIMRDTQTIRHRLTGASETPATPVRLEPVSTSIPNGAEVVLKASYTQSEAVAEKAEIESLFRRGEISYDKKRGLKMKVTKATEGWSPVPG
jgi:hypothetical protein